ncbi:MAG: flavodoxin domain-containing protein [Lachnospiraceae bacterium]|nr:flavodoxin domain-containing protein [Lachnospiraceae bacterium]
MNILVTYQSKTGFTKRYAQWIGEELSCECKELPAVDAAQIAGYELVIHGGWIMGGMVNGLEKIKSFHPQKLIVFGVGFTDKKEVDMEKWRTENKLSDIPFFYYEGGMNPEKMGLMGKTIVRLVTKKKPEYVDYTKKDKIRELVDTVKAL